MKPSKTESTKRGSRYNIEALARGLDVLSLFSSQNKSLSLTEVVSLLELSKTTVFRLLSTLESMGYLDLDPDTRRYSPSIKVLQLGFSAINSLEVHDIAKPHMERLAQELDETVTLGVMEGNHVIYLDRVRNKSIVGLVLKIGSQLAPHCSTIGKVLLADLQPEQLQTYLNTAKFIQFTNRTISNRDDMYRELLKVRQNGYAICDGELAVGLTAAGAPIYNHHQKAIAGINVTGTSNTITINRLEKIIIPALVKTAAQISFTLGYSPARMHEGWKTILE